MNVLPTTNPFRSMQVMPCRAEAGHWLGVLASSLALACATEAARPCEPVIDGIPVINAAAPASRTLPTDASWIELWRAGGLREGQELLTPVSVAVRADGMVAIPDFGLAEVVTVGPDGGWRGSVFRKGPGPEELQTPAAAAWSSDGDLWVFDVVSPKVLRYRDGDGSVSALPVSPDFTAPVVSSGELIWAGVQRGGAVLLQPGSQPIDAAAANPAQHRALLLRERAADTPIDTLASIEFPVVSANRLHAWPVPGWPRLVAAVGLDGAIAVGGFDDSYRVLIRDARGVVLRQICRDVAPLPLRPSERGEFDVRGLEALATAIRDAPRAERPAPYGRLVLGADGSLWVQRERPAAYPGEASALWGWAGARYDVFDADGTFRGSVKLPDGASLAAVRGDTIWTFVHGSLDEVELVAYGLVRR
jgi:hypothetical protein